MSRQETSGEMTPRATNASGAASRPRNQHVCPWWVGYLLASPLRRLTENPVALLSPHLRRGMTVIDLGAAMGFFSLPAARLVGATGRVVCLDIQERMLRSLAGRARRQRLAHIIEPRLCTQVDLGIADLAGTVDFVLAINVMHETENPDRVLRECMAALRPGSRLLLSEPRGHVSAEDFDRTVERAMAAGFLVVGDGAPERIHTVLLARPA